MMRFVTSLLRDNWDKQINIICDDQTPLLPVTHSPNTAFPLLDVQNYTTQYVVSKRERPVRGIVDDRLMKLVCKSEQKDVALAACTHLLSPQAIRTLLVREFARLDTTSYLKLLLVAHQASTAVDDLEYERAKALLLAYSVQVDMNMFETYLLGRHIENLKQFVGVSIKTPVPTTSLVHASLQTAIVNACPPLRAELELRHSKQDWHGCWTLISWLSALPQDDTGISPSVLDPVELLDRYFSDWRMWAAWKPLNGKHARCVVPELERAHFEEFMALEGPTNDFSNVCESLKASEIEIGTESVAHVGNLRYQLSQVSEEEAIEKLDMLNQNFSHILTCNNHDVEILSLMCDSKVISIESQELLSALVTSCDLEISLGVLSLLRTPEDQAVKQANVAKLLKLLHAIGNNGREMARVSAIGRLAVNEAVAAMQEIQARAQKWENAHLLFTPNVVELELQDFVNDLKQACTQRNWLFKMVEEPIRNLLENWPSKKTITILHQIRVEFGRVAGTTGKELQKRLDLYVRHLLFEHGCVDADTAFVFEALVSFWLTKSSPKSRALAVLLSNGKGKFRAYCISLLPLLSLDELVILNQVMKDWAEGARRQDKACEDLATFLCLCAAGAADSTEVKILNVWKPVLYRMLKTRGIGLLEGLQRTSSVDRYLDLFANINIIFGEKVVWNAKLSPAIMNPSLRDWADRLAIYRKTLTNLAENDSTKVVVGIFLVGKDPWALEGILCHLNLGEHWAENTLTYEVSIGITSLLNDYQNNAQQVYDVLCSVYQMSAEGVVACARMLHLCKMEKEAFASVLFLGWLEDVRVSYDRDVGLRDVAKLLQLDMDTSKRVSDEMVVVLTDDVETQYVKLLAEAKRLDYLRIDLKSHDRNGVEKLLEEASIEDASLMEDAFVRLPIELLNVVEKIDDSQVEIIFPLIDLTLLQRAALGLGDAQSLIIRLFLGEESQAKFCIHLDNEAKLDSQDIHSPWVVFGTTRAPEVPICHGSTIPVTYQLARLLSRYLAGGFKDLLSLHTLVSTSLKTMGSACIICGTHHGVRLRKATVCNAFECTSVFSRAPAEIRLASIRQDPVAVDMLITMIQAAISSGHHNLLPDCPFDKDTCLKIMGALPSMRSLSESSQFSLTIAWHGQQMDQFLTWVCCSFRGFLSSATGPLRIPSLPPGTLQFVLANAAPMKEMTFLSEFSSNLQQSRVVFHGTSLDRLYLILHQGLRIMSGTPLQAYGASSGSGVYLAEEPKTSWAYADRKKATRPNWANSAIKGGRVLLGCELTGPSSLTARNGVHVIQKEAAVMVRYVFFVPTETATLPIAGHLAPAMMSVYNSLRSGAL